MFACMAKMPGPSKQVVLNVLLSHFFFFSFRSVSFRIPYQRIVNSAAAAAYSIMFLPAFSSSLFSARLHLE